MPLLLEGLCKCWLRVGKEGCLGEENKDLKAQAPSEKAASLEEELAKLKAGLTESRWINFLLNTKNNKLIEDYLGLRKKHEEVVSQWDKLQSESSGFDLQIIQLNGYRDPAVAKASSATQEVQRLKGEVKHLRDAASQHPKKLWVAIENFKQSVKFEGAFFAAVEHFKKSPEFLDALGANDAYGVCSFVRKYKEKYLGLRSDYEEFQEGYNSSWFSELSLDAPSEDEEEEE
ncbi:hypothetical protein LIER_37479 [Lithospermum erythrorhizon]|uniref:Uncharacterized protein n=1 Tax=Lithospermum erythrorhizon TaxID=34254 RepID=A0AAV3PPY6_LITER